MHFGRVFKKASLFFIGISLMSVMFFSGPVAAEAGSDCSVVASFHIHFVSGTDILVDIVMDVDRLTTDRTYTADEINVATDLEMGALRYELYLMLKSQLEHVFPHANLLNFSMPEYRDERFHESLGVQLTAAFFELNETVNAHDIINGVLDMDAVVLYSFDFQAENGWNNTYTVILPDSMTFRNTTGTVNGNQIQWALTNWNGTHPSTTGWLSLQSTNPTTHYTQDEDILLEFRLDLSNIQNIALTTNIIAEGIDSTPYAFLPEFITNLDIIPADGMRLFIDNGFVS